jgi:hypothetical protein
MNTRKGHVSIRFHLARGEHYQHWQIRSPDGDVCYLDPSETVLLLLGAKLRNQRATAEKIFAGEDKTVCAWIEVGVDDYSIVSRNDDVFYRFFNLPSDALRIEYNPRIAPYWRLGGEDVDNKVFPCLVTHNRSVCLPRKP